MPDFYPHRFYLVEDLVYTLRAVGKIDRKHDVLRLISSNVKAVGCDLALLQFKFFPYYLPSWHGGLSCVRVCSRRRTYHSNRPSWNQFVILHVTAEELRQSGCCDQFSHPLRGAHLDVLGQSWRNQWGDDLQDGVHGPRRVGQENGTDDAGIMLVHHL